MEMSGKTAKETLTVVISSDGQVTVQVQGVAGPSCLDLTKFLEQSLGQVSDRQYTSDYYNQTQINTSVKNKKY